MAVAGNMAARPGDDTTKGNRKVSASFTEPNATGHSPANVDDSTVNYDSTNTNDASIAPAAGSSTAPAPHANITPGRSLAFAESLLYIGQITREQFDTLTAQIKDDMNAIGREHPLTFAIAGNVNISHSLKHREVEATAAVFNIAELVETILLLLPAEDLILRVPRVCRGFRDAIESSQKLQGKAYILAVPFKGEIFDDFSFFPFKIPELKSDAFAGGWYARTSLSGTKAKIFDRYAGIRARQISCPAVKSMTFSETYLADGIGEYERGSFGWGYECIVRKGEGITFGDVFDLLKQVKFDSRPVLFDLDPDVNRGSESSA